MSDTTELLNSVRDIHEPLPPESSSALLLVLLMLLFVLVSILALVALFKSRRKINKELQAELNAIGSVHSDTALVQIATVLRRVMHHVHGDKINQLEGNNWLAALDSTFTTNYFSEGKGSILGSALYSPATNGQHETQALCRDISQLIGKLKLNKVP